MPSMPGTVTKTKTFTAMDGFWSANQAGLMTDYDKKDFQTLLNEAVANGWIPKSIKDHVTNHWLPVAGYFGAVEAEDVLRRGLYWAMRVAVFEDAGGKNEKKRAKVLPIFCAWVCSGGKPHPKKGKPLFEVITLESAQQVTLLFLTPSAEGAGWGRKGDPLQPVWATRRIEFETYKGEEQLEEWGPGNVVTTRTVRPYDYEEP